MDEAMGCAIRCVREARGLTQQQLADLSNLTVNYISLLETGKRSLSDHALNRIARAFRVPVLWLQILAAPSADISSGKIGKAIDHVRATILSELQATIPQRVSPQDSTESSAGLNAIARDLESVARRLRQQIEE
jgi:transcriptional regulator with XRE-family HTH domain